MLFRSYGFPGNVRELKNLAEQISVLSKDKQISAEELQTFLPANQFQNLPVLSGGPGMVSQAEFANEREILYKLFFDMKKDVNELKKMVFDMAQHPGMANNIPVYNPDMTGIREIPVHHTSNYNTSNAPVIIHNGSHENNVQHHEDVEESLNILDMEKELIIKALKKHKSKRRDAATDLGISERTLYRKLKEYDIEHL